MNEAWMMLTYDNKPITVEFEARLLSGEEQVISTPFNTRNLNIKTVRVVPQLSACDVELSILSNADTSIAEKLYKNDTTFSTGSAEEGIYDNIDMIYIDGDGTSKLHCRIKNTGALTTTFKAKIMALTVR
ncbi:hypothetical protein [Paenibacillus sp. FSL P2-0136]|uniref:hypothetical protein n=1 Tax=Paenibacillus sp. FSL P2-0136 TaxID=2975317 RepID=UPI0030D9F741